MSHDHTKEQSTVAQNSKLSCIRTIRQKRERKEKRALTNIPRPQLIKLKPRRQRAPCVEHAPAILHANIGVLEKQAHLAEVLVVSVL